MNGQHRVGEFLQDFKLENKWAEQIYLAVIRAHNKVTAAFTTNTFFTGCFEGFAPKVGLDHFSICEKNDDVALKAKIFFKGILHRHCLKKKLWRQCSINFSKICYNETALKATDF